ncbi:uncharacterized protein LOC133625763 isoform X2 [Colius striatus]|uniref:uncharacterized protein LOC133625763 isoform X2 n=1 Tax=Colius striatus TaxID=57412 RepID=UPI002B1D6FFF|nr:uncharacterized protein LOC133625763 isoform X2 [Colius striatus]
MSRGRRLTAPHPSSPCPRSSEPSSSLQQPPAISASCLCTQLVWLSTGFVHVETKLLPRLAEDTENLSQLSCAASSQSGGQEQLPEKAAGWTWGPGDSHPSFSSWLHLWLLCSSPLATAVRAWGSPLPPRCCFPLASASRGTATTNLHWRLPAAPDTSPRSGSEAQEPQGSAMCSPALIMLITAAQPCLEGSPLPPRSKQRPTSDSRQGREGCVKRGKSH